MANIDLIDVEKYFGTNYIIRRLNLTIGDGEFVVLLGPSGCGKTTTLRAIAGLEDISAGTIAIDGVPVQHQQASDRDIAFVFQLFALYPHLTVNDNIAFPLRAMRESRAVIEQRVGDVCRSLRIEHLRDKKPSGLSGGDLQRVAIGRALVRRPKAMLMDEPIGALDAKLREEMRAELKHLHRQNGSTTVYVTHDQIEAMSMADKIAVMNEGVLQQVGTPDEVYHRPANLFVAQFIGSPIMNILSAAVHEGEHSMGVVLADEATRFEFPKPMYQSIAARTNAGARVALGVRPEAVHVALTPEPGCVPVEAHLIEPLGPYDIVDLKIGADIVRARTASRFVERPGTRVWARFDHEQAHFFDSASGNALHQGA